MGIDHFYATGADTPEDWINVFSSRNQKSAEMRRIWSMILCGSAGFWLGANYQVPEWMLWSLVVLGTLMWILGEWIERRETRREQDHDRTH